MLFDDIQNFLAKKSIKPKLVAVIGPTASGKTDISVQIAKKYDGEIINADSRQMYKYLSIGTASPTEKEKSGVPHHLFDFLDPKDECNVAEWREFAEKKIYEITQKDKLPILCGGTGLFVNALTQNFSLPSIPPNAEFRKKMEQKNSEELWKNLKEKDPEEASRIDPQNKKYIIRALEIYEFSGEKKSQIMNTGEALYDTFVVGITLPRDLLYKKIDQRTDTMENMGFLDEVKELLHKGYSKEDPAMMSHGYREALEYLEGARSLESLLEIMKKNTRNYAKRQLTWWRRDTRVHWYNSYSQEAIITMDSEF